MVSTSDVQQAVFTIVFVFSSTIVTIANNKLGVYDTLVVYYPWLAHFTGVKIRAFLTLLAFGSIVAVVIIQQFKKQDRPL